MIRSFVAVAVVVLVVFVTAAGVAGELTNWSPALTLLAGFAAVCVTMRLLVWWSGRVLQRRFPTTPL